MKFIIANVRWSIQFRIRPKYCLRLIFSFRSILNWTPKLLLRKILRNMYVKLQIYNNRIKIYFDPTFDQPNNSFGFDSASNNWFRPDSNNLQLQCTLWNVNKLAISWINENIKQNYIIFFNSQTASKKREWFRNDNKCMFMFLSLSFLSFL